MKRPSRLSAAVALVAALLLTASSSAAAKKLLVVTAVQGFPHTSRSLAEKVLAGLGEQNGLFTIDTVRGGKDGKGTEDFEKLSPDALKNYDGVIFANTTGDLPLPDKEAFIKWVQSGKDRKSVV